jgi:hypothetical protein
MHKRIADLWIADLEKNPPQTRAQLFDGYGYCCLGRLCLLAGVQPEKRYGSLREFTFEGERTVLPTSVMEWAELASQNGEYFDGITKYLSSDNDDGKTFPEIAQIIRANWEIL